MTSRFEPQKTGSRTTPIRTTKVKSGFTFHATIPEAGLHPSEQRNLKPGFTYKPNKPEGPLHLFDERNMKRHYTFPKRNLKAGFRKGVAGLQV
jgi:hypothetical protein